MVPGEALSSSTELLMALISTKLRPLFLGSTVGSFHEL